jgi:hypothetical protein
MTAWPVSDVEVDTVASFTSSASAVEVASIVVDRLNDDGYRCSRITDLDGSATFSTKIRRLSMLVVIYPNRPEPDQWVLSVGSPAPPSARLLGMSGHDQRSEIGTSVADALAENSVIGPVRWYTDEAWAIMKPPLSRQTRRGWWSRP